MPERLARVEAEQTTLSRSTNRHDDWISGHEKWTLEQRDLVYKTIYETESRVMERLERVEEKMQTNERDMMSRLNRIEIRVGVITAIAAALGAIIPTVLAKVLGP